jgi:hypothetical protein
MVLATIVFDAAAGMRLEPLNSGIASESSLRAPRLLWAWNLFFIIPWKADPSPAEAGRDDNSVGCYEIAISLGAANPVSPVTSGDLD